MAWNRTELDSFRGHTLPDLIGPNPRLLLVGFNPGLRSVAVQAPFASPSNRFWPALHRSGILERPIVASGGLRPEDRAYVISRGIGVTSLVREATARASELTAAQLRDGAATLTARVPVLRPAVVAILGVTAFRIAFQRPHAVVGPQAESIGGVPVWIVPSPSGLNAHTGVEPLAAAFREVAVAAGIPVSSPER